MGDSPEQDIAGARALGMTTVLIREEGAPPPGSGVGAAAEPHHHITRLSEVLPLALRLSASRADPSFRANPLDL